MPFMFQVRVVPLDPKRQTEERKKTLKELSALKLGAVICVEVYENSMNGFENRLLVVTRQFNPKLEHICLAGIPEMYATRPNYPKMSRLVERDVHVNEIAIFRVIKDNELVQISTKNGEEATGRFLKANVENGYPGLAKLEIVLIGGTKKRPLEEIVEISDVNALKFLERKGAKKEVFEPYEFR
jgi:hypothetical protein